METESSAVVRTTFIRSYCAWRFNSGTPWTWYFPTSLPSIEIFKVEFLASRLVAKVVWWCPAYRLDETLSRAGWRSTRATPCAVTHPCPEQTPSSHPEPLQRCYMDGGGVPSRVQHSQTGRLTIVNANSFKCKQGNKGRGWRRWRG